MGVARGDKTVEEKEKNDQQRQYVNGMMAQNEETKKQTHTLSSARSMWCQTQQQRWSASIACDATMLCV
jgi:hypothetical protein